MRVSAITPIQPPKDNKPDPWRLVVNHNKIELVNVDNKQRLSFGSVDDAFEEMVRLLA